MSPCTKFAAGAALMLVALSGVSQAQATQTVTFAVQEINQISASGSPSLTISTATAGSQPTQATATGHYAITTNDSTRKITIALDDTMPTDVTLKATLAAPAASGASAGALTLTKVAQDAVTGITQVAESNLLISYTLDALVTAGVVNSSTRTVTLTIVAGP
ncbi:MAG TPA: hypothetical protein VN706_00065 [Gemmatimonadaceae bacterium]|nr:hypothetical protein [Gemmatimonadaceae bacterium]